MGSLNDYGRGRNTEPSGRSGKWKWLLLWQCAGAAALFFIIGSTIGTDNLLGQASRYVAVTALAEENSWVDFYLDDNSVAPVSTTDAAISNNNNADSTKDNTADNTDAALDQSAQQVPRFSAPASGVVVTELAVAASGFATQQGILIQGSPGQSVKAAAAGTVSRAESSDNGYIVEMQHNAGFSSIYHGLSELSVSVGDELNLGHALGTSSSGEVSFSLLKDNAEVDPLEYLFN